VEVHRSDARSDEIAEELPCFARDMDAGTLVMGGNDRNCTKDLLLDVITRSVIANAIIHILLVNLG